MARIVTIPTAGVSDAMAAYTIGFARLEFHDRIEDAIGAGSGTLVSVGKVRGILTAAHVLTHLPDRGEKRITKAEAIVRGVVVGALKGDSRNTAILFRLAEQVGQFQDDDTRDITRIERVIVSWKPPGAETEDDV